MKQRKGIPSRRKREGKRSSVSHSKIILKSSIVEEKKYTEEYQNIGIKIKRHRETRSNKLVKGEYGIQVEEFGRRSEKQIEAVRKVVRRKMKRKGKIWIRVKADVGVTKKPTEVRMGKGKGAEKYKEIRVKAGKIRMEASIHGKKGVSEPKTVKKARKGGLVKIGIRAKVIEIA